MNSNRQSPDDDLRRFLDDAFKQRTRSGQNRIHELEEAASAHNDSVSWRCRFLLEIAAHRRLHSTRGTEERRKAAHEAKEAFQVARRLQEPLLLAMASREYSRYGPRAEAKRQLTWLTNAYCLLHDTVRKGYESPYGSQGKRYIRLLSGAIGLRYGWISDNESRLAVYRHARATPGMSVTDVSELYDLEIALLRKLDRLSDRDRLLSEFNERTDLGDAGAYLAHKLAAGEASRRQAWLVAAQEYGEAACLGSKPKDRGNRWNDAAFSYFRAGELESAEECLDEAQRAWQEARRAVTGRMVTLRMLARVAHARRDTVGALRLLRECVELGWSDGSRSYPLTMVALLEIIAEAEDQIWKDQKHQTFQVADQRIALCETWKLYEACKAMAIPLSAEHARLAIAQGVLVIRGLLEEQQGFLEELSALAEARERFSLWRTGQLHILRAQLWAKHGNSDAAADAALQGIEAYEGSRRLTFSMSRELADIGWLRLQEMNNYLVAREILVSANRLADAARVAETSRESLIDRLLLRLSEEEGETGRHLAIATELLPEPTDEETDAHEDGPDRAEEIADERRQRQSRRASARLMADTLNARVVSMLGTQAGLREPFEPIAAAETLAPLLYLDLTDSGLLHWLAVDRRSNVIARPPRPLTETSRRVIKHLATRVDGSGVALLDSAHCTVLQELGEAVFPSSQEQAQMGLGPGDILSICPAGELWALPYSMLPMGGSVAVEKLFCRLVPSARVLQSLLVRQLKGPPSSCLAFFHPDLKGTRLEEETLHRLFGDDLIVIKEAAALSDLLKSNPSPSLLVIGAHGDTDHTGTLQQIVLQDGVALGVGEMLDLSFGNITVLGGCWVGRGGDTKGLGPIGMVLPALIGGASSFVAGLWEIDDKESGRILSYVYEELRRGEPMSKALILAQRRWLTRRKLKRKSKPSRWAGLIAIGV